MQHISLSAEFDATNPQMFCFPEKTSVNGQLMRAPAIFSAGLHDPKQYSASRQGQDGCYLLFGISNCPEVLQLGF